jgi:hypothetical protein
MWLTPQQKLNDACRDPAFATFVDNGADPSAKLWATFCLSLAKQNQLSHGACLCRAIMHEPRAALLGKLVGFPMPARLTSLLIRLAPIELDVPMIRKLARDAANPVTLGAIATLDQITRRLVSQLERVPERFRTSGVLSVLNHLELSQNFWRTLDDHLALIPPDLAGSIEARLRRARSRGAFFDAASAAWAYGRENGSFAIQTTGEFDARLKMLESPAAMAGEARRMKNCLANYRFLPQDGQVAYAAWWGAEAATVELLWGARRWRLGNVRGWKNATVSALTHAEIESAVNAWSATSGRPRASTFSALGFVRRQARQAARAYPAVLSNQLRSELEAIRGKSVAGRDNAHCIFNYGDGYIQCASDEWGNVYICEISSHRYVPEIEARLTEKVFYFLNAAGFEWPKGLANFTRRFFISDTHDLDELAKFSLAALTAMTGLSPADRPKITMRIPITIYAV